MVPKLINATNRHLTADLRSLTSHSTQYRSFRRPYFYRSDPTNSVKALKEDNNKHKKTQYRDTNTTRSQAVARIADRTAKNCRGHVT